jgi:hypothetical protein
MARSSILVTTLAAALIAGSVGMAHAQAGGGGGGAGGTGGSAGTAGSTGSTGTAGAAGTNTSPGATQTNPAPSATTGTKANPSIGSTNPGSVGNASGTNLNLGGGGHRQPKASDLPRKDRHASKRDKREKDVDRLVGGICRGC